jgi:hypothetical protein
MRAAWWVYWVLEECGEIDTSARFVRQKNCSREAVCLSGRSRRGFALPQEPALQIPCTFTIFHLELQEDFPASFSLLRKKKQQK